MRAVIHVTILKLFPPSSSERHKSEFIDADVIVMESEARTIVAKDVETTKPNL
jgi:hypothetical protein